MTSLGVRWSFLICILFSAWVNAAPADHSTSTPLSGPSGVHLEGREVKIFQGRVQEIRPPKGGIGLDAWSTVVLAGSGPVAQRTFRILMDSPKALPFKVGDSISAKIDCSRGGWHHVCDLVLRNAAKALLLVIAASGDITLVPGWTITTGPVLRVDSRKGSGKSIRRELGLIMTFSGRTAVTHSKGWRRLATTDGTWIVTGRAVAWEGLRPPEGVDYTSFAIMRVR